MAVATAAEAAAVAAEAAPGLVGAVAKVAAADDARLVHAMGRLPEGVDDLWAHESSAFEALLAWKRGRAKELGFNDPCVICHNKTLCQLVRLAPARLADLRHVWGIGAKRAAQHGELMLGALAPFRAALLAQRHDVPAPMPVPPPTELKERRGGRVRWCDEAGVEAASAHWREAHEVIATGLNSSDCHGIELF